MTSTLRSYVARKELPTTSTMITSAYYTGSDGNYHLFPFTYNNGTLDLSLTDPSFQTDYMDTPNRKPDDTLGDPAHRYLLRGGAGLVAALGPNVVKYIRAAWDLSASSPVRIQQTGSMTKVQEMDAPDDGESFLERGCYESPNPPLNDEYPTPGPHYRSPWIFKTPLTISIVRGGVTSYLTFASTIGRDNY